MLHSVFAAAPAKGISFGSDIGQEELQKFIGNDQWIMYKAEQRITTADRQKLAGKLILADSRFTFLLTQKVRKGCAPILTVYKLSNSDNKVLRQTVLTLQADAAQPVPKDC